ncbi:8541_t:CDS:1, partial [Gigaspora rosea]
MLNQRTSEFCEAVQARHTVSAIEDIAPNISEFISSSPFEILLSNPNNNLVLTYPDDELLPDDNENTITVSLLE